MSLREDAATRLQGADGSKIVRQEVFLTMANRIAGPAAASVGGREFYSESCVNLRLLQVDRADFEKATPPVARSIAQLLLISRRTESNCSLRNGAKKTG